MCWRRIPAVLRVALWALMIAAAGWAHVEHEAPYGPLVPTLYALVAQRHMHEFGTTAEQLAWIKVAASHHAQHNPNAMLREVVTAARSVWRRS